MRGLSCIVMPGLRDRRRAPSVARAAGFGMVETLVAVLVVAVGIIGSLRLLASGLRETRSALWRTQAVVLADDLADRMRANPAALDAYDPRSYPAGADRTACDAMADCSPEQIAETDVAQWLDLLAVRLPQRDASIDIEPAAADGATSRVRIAIRWRDPAAPLVSSYAGDAVVTRPGPPP